MKVVVNTTTVTASPVSNMFVWLCHIRLRSSTVHHFDSVHDNIHQHLQLPVCTFDHTLHNLFPNVIQLFDLVQHCSIICRG